MAKKQDKAIKSLKKDVAKLKKQNDKLAEKLEQTREDQASALNDLRSFLDEQLAARDSSTDEQKDNSPDGDEEPEVTNAAQRRAEELDIDLSDVKGTGSGGRILVKDVEAAMDAK